MPNVPKPRTLRGLNKVFGFRDGKGVERVLEGREPVRKPAEKPTQPEDVVARAIREINGMSHLSPFEKQVFIDMIEGTLARLLEQAEETNHQRARGPDA